METNPVLGLLGLSRRAGKLACGEEQVGEMVMAGKCRAIFLAEDAGDATRRKVMRHDARVPVFSMPCTRETLGNAIGVPGWQANWPIPAPKTRRPPRVFRKKRRALTAARGKRRNNDFFRLLRGFGPAPIIIRR